MASADQKNSDNAKNLSDPIDEMLNRGHDQSTASQDTATMLINVYEGMEKIYRAAMVADSRGTYASATTNG